MFIVLKGLIVYMYRNVRLAVPSLFHTYFVAADRTAR
jgi:hypothetical protein